MLPGFAQFFERRGAPTPPLPYDAEVEYLESTGTQWIDTGVVPDFNTECRLSFAELSYVASSIISGTKTGTSSNERYFAAGTNGNGSLRFVLGGSQLNTSITYGSTFHEVIFNETDTHKVFYDGNSLGFFSRGNSVVDQNSLYLFGVNGYGSNHYVSNSRIAYFQIFKSGVLVCDFIPVRFTNELGQSEGAMYDRVSKQLFRNQGTGNFIVGRDISPISARSYVNDGLVAMWDGIENAGWGTHDPNATTWKDLSPSGFDLTNQQGAFDSQFYWKADCIYCNDGSGSRFFGAIGGIPQSLVDAVNSGDVTIQGVVRHMRSTSAGFLLSQLYEGGLSNNLKMLCPVYGGNAAIREQWSSVSVQYGLPSTSAPLVAERPSFISLTKLSDSSMTSLCVVNGVSFSAEGNSGNYNAMTTTGRFALMGMGASAFWNARHTIGELYAIRLYSRALTAAEIAANYAIDKARFNLP